MDYNLTQDLSDLPHEAATFRWLGDLVSTGTSIGVLATAIEKHGIYGYDRFGRWKHFALASDEAAAVLETLARIHAADEDPMRESSQLDDDPVGNPTYAVGWPVSDCPDFEALDREAGGKPQPPASRKAGGRPNNDKELIAVLWGLIRGELRCNAHPDFPDNAAIIDHIIRQAGFDGLSESTLLRKFSDAKRLLNPSRSPDPQNSPGGS